MIDFISRLIFQDDFSATAKKYEQSTDNVVKSTESAGRAVEQASSKVGKLKSALAGIRGTHKTEVKAVGLGTVEKNVATIQSQIERLTNKPVSITAQAKLTRNDIKLARSEIKELKAQLKDLTGQKYDISLDVNGTQVQTLSGKLKGSAGMALSVAGGSLLAGGIGAAVAGVGSGIGSAVGQMWSGGNERQQYLSSMTHFMGSEQGARDMMAWANENARTTQFSSGEVLAAASRAIQVADGNAAEAQRFTQLAEDMASLTPGKTVMDALEALADAQMGEFERMKEFGFKGSADELKAAGGDFWSMKSTSNGKTVEEMFAGGTASGAQNTAAKIGTITGTFEDALSSVGEKMLNGLNPALDWVISKSEGVAGGLEDFLTSIGTTVSGLLSAVQPLAPALSVVGSIVGGVVRFGFTLLGSTLNNIVIPVVGALASAFNFGIEIANKLFPKMEGVGTAAEEISNLFSGLGDVVKNVTGGIRDLGGSLWNWVKGLFGSEKHATGGMAVGGLTQINENMKGELIRLPNGSRIYPYETTRKLLQREIGGNRRASNHNVITVQVDARGSNLTREQVYRLKREIVSDIVEAFDNMVPA